jgi:iron complex outermembrane receptor protein
VSLSWRPNSDLTIFGNYKQGFLSGGYNGSSDVLVPGQLVNRPDYGPEKVRGFEVGIKSNLMNNLRVNLYAFYYKALGLQVASYQQGFSTIRNAGKVNIKGVEGDFNWRTPVQGLELRGAFAYTRSIYAKYEAPCYTGQTQALGCTINLYGDPLPQTQDLAGTQVPNAPYWVINGGFNYETAMGSNLKLGLSGDVNFNTSYVTDSKNTPFSRSPKQALIDASVRVGAENDRWEVALVGRNLTNRFYWVDSQENFPSGSGTGGPAGTVSVVGDRTAVISRGRELWLRLSLSY